MLDMLGDRQKALLRLLLKDKAGVTVDAMSERLGITRNAVRQHLAALENDDLVMKGASRATGGRPEQLYVLTEKGRECFPRHYAWFAELLIESVQRELGADQLAERLDAMGTRVGQQLRAQQGTPAQAAEAVQKLADIMQDLGYDAATVASAEPVIEANNCVFHTLAMRHPQVCSFDLALMAAYTGRAIEHQQCMATGGHVCRFKFS